MRVIIMADGEGKRWNNYTGVPKHLIDIDGEQLLYRTVRLLKENGIEDIYITSHDKRYEIEGTTRYEPKNNLYEIDRFCSCYPIWKEETLFLYGDVYYTEEAMKTIINTDVMDFEFFGRFGQREEFKKNNGEIFAVKIKNINWFKNACEFIREEEKKGNLRGIGWDVYKTLLHIPYKELYLKGNFTVINDETEDFDSPEEYENWLNMQKIVFYFPNIYIGGTEKAMLELIKKLCDKHEIIVAFDKSYSIDVVLEMSNYAEIINVKYKPLSCKTLVYVSHYGRPKIKAKKYVQWNHTSIGEVDTEPPKRTNINVWVSVSNEAKKQLDNKFNVDSMVIRNETAKVDVTDDVFKQTGKLNLLTVSRISKEKGFERMLEMVKRLEERKIDYKWYVIGKSHQQKYEKEIKEQFKIYPNVIFVGEKQNPYPYFNNVDYGVMLSDRESDCLFVRECRSINIPVIVSKWNGVEEQIVDGDNGYILNMDLSNLDIDKIMKKELRPNNVLESEYKKWEEIL